MSSLLGNVLTLLELYMVLKYRNTHYGKLMSYTYNLYCMYTFPYIYSGHKNTYNNNNDGMKTF